ncbi:hypothetical protein SAMN04488058_104217 [Deinococcus reticulitermitis]|uniref:BREX system P-loop protein BrxC n=1 Tax=Deinococcus reticulitermitis TaxID=856736 RepID=A0A1H6WU83_9DEIO|nr:BREX system P-loop protein BrxC [Deinococcus reticulitermitis]SEJ17817.1 hypothetical protein SAMN04488058_104217 [Deinococcus reticulitermitis]
MTTMNDIHIAELFEQDIRRVIDPVVIVTKDSDEKLIAEIDEYVVTDAIRQAFTHLLKNYVDIQAVPTQKIGVWVSGFFGSGKSSFAKMLGYMLDNPVLTGEGTSESVRTRLLRRFGNDASVAELVTKLDGLARPTRAVVFDLSQEAATGEDLVSHITYRQLLKHFGYSPRPVLAELELQLEREGRYQEFLTRFEAKYGKAWTGDGAFDMNRASAVMHDLEPGTYNHADSWAKSQGQNEIRVNPELLTNRAIEMAQRRGNGCNVVFVVDEVGQFAGRSVARMLDVQGIVHAFDRGGTTDAPSGSGVEPGAYRGRLWFVVTAQEQLSAVVENLDSNKTELGRLIDRFQQPVDLKPQDITEVTTQRLLRKKPQFEPALRDLFKSNQGALRLHTEIDANTKTDVSEADFVNLYPLLPYQFDLIIGVISAIRSQGTVGPTYGAAVRPILAMVKDVLNDPHLGLADAQVGQLVRFDQIYDTLGHRIPDEPRNAINLLQGRLKTHGEPGAVALRAAKALVLLGLTRSGVNRTVKTVAAVLYPEVGAAGQESLVRGALDLLVREEQVREQGGVYEFLSPEARTWEQERNGFDPGARIREQVRKAVADALGSAAAYNHKSLRTFKPTLYLDGKIPTGVTRGDVDLRLMTVGDAKDAYADSQQHPRAVSGIIEIGRNVEDAARSYLRSDFMLGKYRQDTTRAKQVAEESRRLREAQTALERAVTTALQGGTYYHNGRPLEVAGANVNKLVDRLFSQVIDRIYTSIEKVSITPAGSDLKALLTQDRLVPLQQLLGHGGLDVLRSESGSLVIDANASVFQPLLEEIRRNTSTGQVNTGQLLETTFDAAPHGWTSDRVKFLLATLFRAGVLEIQSGGRKLSSWSDNGVLDAFTNTPNFRAAQFAVRMDSLDSGALLEAITAFSELTGEFISDIDEGVIGRTIRRALAAEAGRARTVLNRLTQHNLPFSESLKAASDALEQISAQESNADVIKLYLQAKSTISTARPVFVNLEEKLTGTTLSDLDDARDALNRYLPLLPDHPAATNAAERLRAALDSDTFYTRVPDILTHTRAIQHAWKAAYAVPWQERHTAYTEATAALKATPEYAALEAAHPEQAEAFAHELQGYGRQPQPEETHWRQINPTLDHLRADIDAAGGRLDGILRRMSDLLTVEDPPKRIRLKRLDLDPQDLGAAEKMLDERLNELKQQVLEALQQGQKVVLE